MQVVGSRIPFHTTSAAALSAFFVGVMSNDATIDMGEMELAPKRGGEAANAGISFLSGPWSLREWNHFRRFFFVLLEVLCM
jgi:hypothetical protein